MVRSISLVQTMEQNATNFNEFLGTGSVKFRSIVRSSHCGADRDAKPVQRVIPMPYEEQQPEPEPVEPPADPKKGKGVRSR